MNLSFALPKSPESSAAGGALEGRNARKTEGSQARDGFSEMLDQLASFIPANAEGDGALPDRQAQDLPGGKELPVDAASLPVLPDDASGTPLGVPQLAVTLETGVVPETGSRAASEHEIRPFPPRTARSAPAPSVVSCVWRGCLGLS